MHRTGLVSGLRELKAGQKVGYMEAPSDGPKGNGKMAVGVQLEEQVETASNKS